MRQRRPLSGASDIPQLLLEGRQAVGIETGHHQHTASRLGHPASAHYFGSLVKKAGSTDDGHRSDTHNIILNLKFFRSEWSLEPTAPPPPS
mmetsp:Transcript_38116/g.89330  ORF Transcript_38116/g.89330 Transcript_38116/m.89330 type:complete len:91 (+) Transcript_38116:1787-2059(+)